MDEQKNAATPQPKPPAPPHAPLEKSEPASKTHYVPHLELKAIILLAFTLVLILGSVVFWALYEQATPASRSVEYPGDWAARMMSAPPTTRG